MPKKFADLVRPSTPVDHRSPDEKIGARKTKMNVADRESLKRQIEDTEANLNDVKDVAPSGDIRAQNEQRKKILQHDEDLEARGLSKDRLAEREEKIREILVREMPSKEEMWRRSGTSESQQAIRHNIHFQDKYGDLVREWQDLKVKLEPDDPYAQSLENIRPDRRTGI